MFKEKGSTFQEWLDQIVSTISQGPRRTEARERLSVLDPTKREPEGLIWNEERCPPQQGPDLKRLADGVVQLACSAESAPHVARGLLYGQIAAIGTETATVADRLRKGKTDPAACPGVKGFTDEDWALLDQIVAAEAAAGAFAPGGR